MGSQRPRAKSVGEENTHRQLGGPLTHQIVCYVLWGGTQMHLLIHSHRAQHVAKAGIPKRRAKNQLAASSVPLEGITIRWD